MSENGVGWKGTLCFECNGRVDQDGDFGFWFHLPGEGDDAAHEIIPCIPNGPPDPCPTYEESPGTVLHCEFEGQCHDIHSWGQGARAWV